MAIKLEKDFYIVNVKSGIDDNAVAKKLLTNLSAMKTTPINISDLKIEKIEKKYLSYMYQDINYDYSLSANVGYNRDVYTYQDVVRKDSKGNPYIENVKKYSHTETDWKRHSNSGKWDYNDVISMNADSENVIVKEIDRRSKNKISLDFLKTLEHDANADLSFFSDLLDIDKVRNSILSESEDRFSKFIDKSIPGDKYEDLDCTYKLVGEEALFISFPLYCIEYTFDNKTYHAYICDILDYSNYSDFPQDIQLEETSRMISNRAFVPFILTAILNFIIWFFLSDDPYYPEIEWWIYGLSISYVLVKFIKLGVMNQSEFQPIRDEKKIRLDEKLEAI